MTITFPDSYAEVVFEFLKSNNIDFKLTLPAKRKYSKKELEEFEDQVLGLMIMEAKTGERLSDEEAAKFITQLTKDAEA